MGKIGAIFALAAALAACPASAANWVQSWGTAQPLGPAGPPPKFDLSKPMPKNPDEPPTPLIPYPATLADQTVRMIVRTSAGGSEFRLEFQNAAGDATVSFDAVHAALAGAGSAIVNGTDRTVTFDGKTGLKLFPGAHAVSDPISLRVRPLTDVAVSIHVAAETPTNTVHALGLNPAYIAPGNVTGAGRLEGAQVIRSYLWLAGLDVPAVPTSSGTIVALGDSITDGFRTTPGAHRDWPELLAARLQKHARTAGWGVVNAGVSGGRILKAGTGEAAVARFDTDVLARPGVKWVLMLEGINDINDTIMPIMPESEHVTAQEIIDGLGQIIDRAHLHGIKIAGCTILGTEGLPFYNAKGEQMRQAVNKWIRTSGRFDAVIDFDAVTRDPAEPDRIRPQFDPGDHVHPNDVGNRAMADAIDLDLFR